MLTMIQQFALDEHLIGYPVDESYEKILTRLKTGKLQDDNGEFIVSVWDVWEEYPTHNVAFAIINTQLHVQRLIEQLNNEVTK